MVTFGLHWVYCVVLFIVSEAFARNYPTMVQTNEVEERHDEMVPDLLLPLCQENSVCGYLQVNSRGINVQKRCACSSGNRCPLVWDAFDGHSVTQGSDQYKYCGAAPQLEVCASGYTAYTSSVIFSITKDAVTTQSDHLKCNCPDDHSYVLAHQEFTTPDEQSEGMNLSYICAPLEPCTSSSVCKAVSVTAREFLVQRRCLCPAGLRCPTDTKRAMHTTPWDKGVAHYIRCQQ